MYCTGGAGFLRVSHNEKFRANRAQQEDQASSRIFLKFKSKMVKCETIRALKLQGTFGNFGVGLTWRYGNCRKDCTEGRFRICPLYHPRSAPDYVAHKQMHALNSTTSRFDYHQTGQVSLWAIKCLKCSSYHRRRRLNTPKYCQWHSEVTVFTVLAWRQACSWRRRW